MRALVVLVLLGCGGARSTATIAAAADTYCPPLPGLGPFAHELFPACPPWPFQESVRVCAGECAEPCSMSGHTNGTDWFQDVTHVHGRLVGIFSDAGQELLACTYERERLSSCIETVIRWSATRDARGRITTIGPAGVTYDDEGRVMSVGTHALRYAAHGLVASVTTRSGAITLERDAAGRVMLEVGPAGERELSYDTANRVLRAVTTATDGSVTSRVFSYDAEGFLVRTTEKRGELTSWTDYQYGCTADAAP